MDKFDPIGEVDLDEGGLWERVMGLNVTAVARLSQVVVKYWVKEGIKGRIVNVGSAASVRGGLAGLFSPVFLSLNSFLFSSFLVPSVFSVCGLTECQYRSSIHNLQTCPSRHYQIHRCILRYQGY